MPPTKARVLLRALIVAGVLLYANRAEAGSDAKRPGAPSGGALPVTTAGTTTTVAATTTFWSEGNDDSVAHWPRVAGVTYQVPPRPAHGSPAPTVLPSIEDQYIDMLAGLMLVPAADIKGLVEAAALEYGVDNTELYDLLTYASGWGSITSLEHVYNYARDNGYQIFADDNQGTLADFLHYLCFKDKANCDSKLFAFLSAATSTPAVVVVDNVLMGRLRSNQDSAATLLGGLLDESHNRKLLVLDGYITGVNLFNQLDIGHIVHGLARAYGLARSRGASTTAARETALRLPILEMCVRALGKEEGTRLYETRIIWLEPPALGDGVAPGPEAIEARLRPRYPSFDAYQGALGRFAEESKCGEETTGDIAWTLTNRGMFLSTTVLASFARKISQSMAAADFVTDVYYAIPKTVKSYCAATLIYLMANPATPPSKVIGEYAFLAKFIQKAQQEPPRMVILDDVAGTGDSLKKMIVDNKQSLWGPVEPDIRVAPLIESGVATQFFASRSVDIVSYPGVRLTSAPPRPWMGSSGFYNGYYFIAFPYMAPDNDCAFMARYLAPLFTYHGSGVKKGWSALPRCGAADSGAADGS